MPYWLEDRENVIAITMRRLVLHYTGVSRLGAKPTLHLHKPLLLELYECGWKVREARDFVRCRYIYAYRVYQEWRDDRRARGLPTRLPIQLPACLTKTESRNQYSALPGAMRFLMTWERETRTRRRTTRKGSKSGGGKKSKSGRRRASIPSL